MPRLIFTALILTLTGSFLLPIKTQAQDVLPDRPAGDVLPDRPLPDRDQDAKRRTQQAIDDIYEKWEEDRNPTVFVMFGIQHEGKVVYNLQSPLVNRITSPLKRHLRDATDRRSVIVPSLKELQDKKVLDRLTRDVGKDLPGGGAEILSKAFDADLIIDITLLDAAERGRYAMNMRVLDTREGIEIASDSLSTVGVDANEARGVLIADAVIRSFAREYAQRKRNPRREFKTYEFKLLGVEQDGGISQRALRTMASMLEDADDKVKWAELDFVGVEDNGFAKFETRFGGRQRDLLNLIEQRVLPDLDLAWRIQQTDDTVIVAYIYSNEIPAWFALTDAKAPDFKDINRKRNAQLARSGLPKLGVVIGEDLNEPLDVFDAKADDAVAFDLQTLEGVLQDQFTQLGFRVVDNATLRRQLGRQAANAIRYDNLPHMLKSMSELDSVDLVLHLNVLPGSNGKQFNARMINVADAQVIGFQNWSPGTVGRLDRYRVNADKPEEVARFITGQMLARYDRFAERDLKTIPVQIRNITSAQAILPLTDLIENNFASVEGVVDIQSITPVASFEIIYSGEPAGLMLGIVDAIGVQYPGAEVQILGDSIVVNADPVLLTEQEVSEKEAELRDRLAGIIGVQGEPAGEPPAPGGNGDQPEPPAPNPNPNPQPQPNPNPQPDPGDTVTPPTPDPATPPTPTNNTNDLGKILLTARMSVYTVGIEVDGNFQGNGTGWQVKDGVLATNAHVVVGLAKRRAELIKSGVPKEKIKFAGLAGPENSNRVEFAIDMVIHPNYAEHLTRWNQFLTNVAKKDGKEAADQLANYIPIPASDVGLLTITSGKSMPALPLATQDYLQTQLNPTNVIAYIGFPSDNLVKLTNLGIPAQQIDLGTVMAVTDFDQRPGKPETRRMIHSDLVSDGGASGSPIFNDRGQVVAVLSAGSIVALNEGAASSSRIRTGVTYGQRVDLVREMLGGKVMAVKADDFVK